MRSLNRSLKSTASMVQPTPLTFTATSVQSDVMKQDYEEKCLALMSVQRNYETISRMMQQKQTEYAELKRKYEDESARCVSLSVQLDDALHRAGKAEAAVTKLGSLQEAYTALQTEHKKLKYEASMSASLAQAANDKLASYQKAAEEADFKASTLQRDRDAWRSEEAKHKADQSQLKHELMLARSEARALGMDLQNTREQVLKAQEATREMERQCATLTARLATRDEQMALLQDNIRSLQDALNEAKSSMRASEVAMAACKNQQAVADGAARSLGRALELAAEEKRLAVDRAAKLEEKLLLAHESASALEQRVVQLTGLLAETEDKYQTSLVQGSEAGEGLTRLQVQLACNKATLAETRQQMADMERTHMSALQSAQAAAAEADQRLADHVARSAKQRHMYTEFLQAMMLRVEKAIAGMSSFQLSFGASINEIAERQQKGMAALGYRLQVWDAQTGDTAERVTHLGAMIRQMASKLTSFKLSQASAAAADSQSSQRLKDRVSVLEGLLAAEQAAKAAAIQSKAKSEEAHSEALATLRAVADDRVAAERQRLGGKLTQVEAEIARLRSAYEEDRAAAARVLELERNQMMREIQKSVARESELQEEINRLQDKVVNGSKNELAILNRRFVEETAATKARHEAEVAELQGSVRRLRESLTKGQDICTQVLAEMGVVVSHLARMGWEVTAIQPGAANDVCQQPDSDGSTLVKLTKLARLHFSYITEAVQNAAKKNLPSTAKRHVLISEALLAVTGQADWPAMAKELKSTVAQLLHVEESLAPSCTCMLCLEVLKHPTTCVPCGHSYCKACLQDHGNLCVQCGDRPVSKTVVCSSLDAVCSKYDYKLSALQSVHKLAATLGTGQAS